MFNCQGCGSTTKPGEKMHKVPTETRPREYHYGNKVSHGWEIVKEAKLCGNCAKDG